MKTTLPASRRKKANCDLGVHKGYIELVPGTNPYLWIGRKDSTFGVVKDSHVEKLRDMCDEILKRRKLP